MTTENDELFGEEWVNMMFIAIARQIREIEARVTEIFAMIEEFEKNVE